eukprot:g61104.t1
MAEARHYVAKAREAEEANHRNQNTPSKVPNLVSVKLFPMWQGPYTVLEQGDCVSVDFEGCELCGAGSRRPRRWRKMIKACVRWVGAGCAAVLVMSAVQWLASATSDGYEWYSFSWSSSNLMRFEEDQEKLYHSYPEKALELVHVRCHVHVGGVPVEHGGRAQLRHGLSVPGCVLAGFSWVACDSSLPRTASRQNVWSGGRIYNYCTDCDIYNNCQIKTLYLRAPSSAGEQWAFSESLTGRASLTTSIPYLFQTDTPSVSASRTRSATTSASSSGSPTSSRSPSPSPSLRPPAVVVRGEGGGCLRAETAAWGDCGTLSEQLDMAVTLHNSRVEWPSYGSGRFAYALAAASALGCDLLPLSALAQNFSLALSPLDRNDGLQQVTALEVWPGAFLLRLTGCGLDHVLRPRVGWVPAGSCGEECLVTLTSPGVSPTSSASGSTSLSSSLTPSRSPPPSLVLLDRMGYCLSQSLQRLQYVDCGGGLTASPNEIWYHITNFSAQFPDCWSTQANLGSCLTCLRCNYEMPEERQALFMTIGAPCTAYQNAYTFSGGLTLDQGRLRLTQPCGASFDVWLQRDLTWARAPEYALQLTVASFPVVSDIRAPPLAATVQAYSAMLKYQALCLRAVRNGSTIDVDLQNCPSIYDSDAIKAPFLFANGGNGVGVFWSGDGAGADYLRYQLRPKSGFCDDANDDAVAMALDFTERFSPLSARLAIGSVGELSCFQSPRLTISLFCCGYIVPPGRYVLSNYAALVSYKQAVFAPFDLRASVTPSTSVTTSITASVTLSTSITASRTPSVSVTPRPLVYGTTQGYVNLVVSRLLASGEELLWLGPTGRVATTLASIALDPRGGLDADSRQAQWCTLLSDADRLLYSVVFANYGVNSNKWYGNSTTVTTTAANSSSEWFELVQVALAGSRNVSAMFGGPLYQLASSGGCVGIGGTTAEHGNTSQCLVTDTVRFGGNTRVASQTVGCNTILNYNNLMARDDRYWYLVTRSDLNANCKYVQGPDGSSNNVYLEITPDLACFFLNL